MKKIQDELDLKQKQLEIVNGELKKNQQENDHLKDDIECLKENYQNKIEKMLSEISSKDQLINKLKIIKDQSEVTQKKEETLKRELEKCRNQIIQQEFEIKNLNENIQNNNINFQKQRNSEQYLIDKRYIASFLINYLDVNNSDKVKNELLETLGSLLDLGEHDRVRIGLENLKTWKLSTAKEKEENNRDIKSLFMEYLKDQLIQIKEILLEQKMTNSSKSQDNIIFAFINKIQQSYFEYFFVSLTYAKKSKFLQYLIFVFTNLQFYFFFYNTKLNTIWKGNYLDIMGQISDVFLITPLLYKTSYITFNIVFYIFNFINFTAFILVFLINEKTTTQNSSNFLLYINQGLSFLFDSIFIIPLILLNLSIFNCSHENDVLVQTNYPEQICFQGTHIVNFSIAILCLIIILIHNSFIKTFFYETQKDSKDAFAKVPQNQFFLFIFQICLLVFYTFLNTETYDYVFLTISLVGSLWLWVSNVIHNPYYSILTKKINRFFANNLLWTIICLYASKITDISLVGDFIILQLIGIPFIFVYSFIESDKHLTLFCNTIAQLQSADKALKKLIYSQFIERYAKFNKNNQILMLGFLDHHKKTCKSETCPLIEDKEQYIAKDQNYQKQYVKQQINKFHQLILRGFKEATKKFSNNIPLRLEYVFFLLEREDNKHEALKQIEISKKNRPSYDQTFILFRYQKLIEEVETTQQSSTFDNLYSDEQINEIAYQKYLKSFLDEMKFCVSLYIEFWQQLQEDKPNLGHIQKLGQKVYKSKIELQKKWQKFYTLFPHYSYKYMLLYSKFFLDIVNDNKKGRILQKEAVTKIAQQVNKKNSLDNFTHNTSVSSMSQGCIIVSGITGQIGQIQQINQQALALFGYQESEVLKQNINILMPEIIQLHHDQYLESAIQKEELSYFKRERLSFGKNKHNFIFQAFLNIKYFTGQSPFFVGTVREKNNYGIEGIILVDWKGYIHNFSQEIMVIFGLKRYDLLELKYLNDFFPDIWDFKEDFEKPQFQKVPLNLIQSSNLKYSIKYELWMMIQKLNFKQIAKEFYAVCIQLGNKTIQNESNDDNSLLLDEENETEQIKGVDFQFNVDIQKKSIIASKRVFHHKKDIQSQKDLTVSNNSDNTKKVFNYGDEIKILRLENGKPIEIQENNTEEDYVYSDDKNIIEEDSEQRNDKNGNKIYNRILDKFETQQKQKSNNQKIHKPLFMKLYILFFHIIFLSSLTIVILNLVFQFLYSDYLKKSITTYITYQQQNQEILNILGQVKRLNIISQGSGYALENNVKQSITNSIDKIKQCGTLLVSQLLNLNNKTLIEFYLNESMTIKRNGINIQTKTTEAIDNVLTTAFTIIETDLKDITIQNENVYFIYYNILNNIWVKMEEFGQLQLTEINNYVSKNLTFLIYQCLLFGLFLLLFIGMYIYVIKMSNFTFEIVSLFVDISNKDIKNYIKKGESFLNNLSQQEADNEFYLLMDNIDDEPEEQNDQIIFTKKRKHLKYSKFSQHKFEFLKLIISVICFFTLICTGFILFYQSSNKTVNLSKELEVIGKISNTFFYTQNAISIFLMDQTITIYNTDAATYLENQFQQLYYLDGNLKIYQVENSSLHSTNFNNFSIALLMKSLCDLNFELAEGIYNINIDVLEHPDPNTCFYWEEDSVLSNLVSDGLSISLSKYQDDMVQIWKYWETNQSNFYLNFNNNYCTSKTLTPSDLCIYNHQLFKNSDQFQNIFLNVYSYIWRILFTQDYESNYIEKQNIIQFYIYLSVILLFLLSYLILFIKFYQNQIINLEITENMIYMIPFEKIEDKTYVLKFFKKRIDQQA